jgi:hypothetical protein
MRIVQFARTFRHLLPSSLLHNFFTPSLHSYFFFSLSSNIFIFFSRIHYTHTCHLSHLHVHIHTHTPTPTHIDTAIPLAPSSPRHYKSTTPYPFCIRWTSFFLLSLLSLFMFFSCPFYLLSSLFMSFSL